MMYPLNLRVLCSLLVILTATLTRAESKIAVFDFSNPTTLSPQITAPTEWNDMTFTCGDISVTFSKKPDATLGSTLTTGGYVKLRKGNRVSINASNNATIISSIFVRGYDNNSFKDTDFSILTSNEGINIYTSKDGEKCFSIPGGDQTVENISGNAQFIAAIRVEYEIPDDLVKIEDMPEGLECKKFDVARVISEGINYVMVSGNYVATGKLNENGHLNVVKFATKNGGINLPLQYTFNLTHGDNDAFYISTPDDNFLVANAAGHFSLTDDQQTATMWNIATDADGKAVISEAETVSRSTGKSIMFSESAGGFGRYDSNDNSMQSPTLYAFTDNTTSIIPEITDAIESEATYFDLRGNRVDINHAANGIYICRQGNHVQKIAIMR